ncbi:hypothetical protein Cni_G15785 [Canna indica]|uniref:Pyruvate kinase n=1 Tax=Canna indica TaxID=4628 RepID=A0AAQ3QDL7_9LILI|nr:hypothetical protein Cni_G15785 [Canna indica]
MAGVRWAAADRCRTRSSIFSTAVKPGDTIFIGQYLFTGSETTSVWLEVAELKGEDVVCTIKNSATLAGSLFTLHISHIRIDLPTLTEADKNVISTWGVRNKIDFLSLSYTRHAEDVRQAREFLSKLGYLYQTQIFAKIENIEGLTHFDEILQEADGIILSRGNLGIHLPSEKDGKRAKLGDWVNSHLETEGATGSTGFEDEDANQRDGFSSFFREFELKENEF